MKIKELAIMLDIPKSRRAELEEVLGELMAEGEIELSKRGKYHIMEVKKMTGTFSAHPKGFGFVTIEGEEQDIFIPGNAVHDAMHGDEVEIRILGTPEGKRTEGEITKVITRATTTVVGLYHKSKDFGFVNPDNQRFTKDVFIKKGNDLGAVEGHKVVVELISYGGEGRKPEGIITSILGHMDDPGVDILSIVKGYGLTVDFPEDVVDEIKDISTTVPEKDKVGRIDLRDTLMITIDGEDSKDLDDAVSMRKVKGGYELGVHIADVSHYVTESAPLDVEAYSRGTSVYLVDRVIPMLPRKLSNGICSLNAGEDRLALSCIMTIDSKGEIVEHQIVESLINVNYRMSYTGVKKILVDQDLEMIEEFKGAVSMLKEMEMVAATLRAKRKVRGSIDFDFPETKIILDDKGNPIDIKPYDRNVATKMIEDFMLAANETVAEDFFWREIPFLYRIHEKPDPEKIQKLALFINNFGYSIKGAADGIHPKELQKLITKVEGSDEEALISRLALRSMRQAKYSAENLGHFGLAATYYSHFTSPIRRYPDLQIHRIIKETLHGQMDEKRKAGYSNKLPLVADQTSKRERRAEEAERETVKLKKVQYMENHMNEEFDGVISSVTGWGMYIELPNTIEGLVHITNLLDDYYEYDEAHYELVGERLHKVYKLGQPVRVKVKDTNRLLRTIDFVLSEG